jgi:predicted O-methyltransferase YrrM
VDTTPEIQIDHLLQSATFGDDPYGYFLERSKSEGLPEIAVSVVFARLLEIFVRLTGATTILEVGTLGGYSAAWMARALPEGGRVLSLEIDSHHADVARQNLQQAGLADKVEVLVGPALETLPGFYNDASINNRIDLSFIDADKVNNPHYVDHAARLSRHGALVIVDNVVRQGRILDPKSEDPNISGTLEVLHLLGSHPQLTATAIQTVGLKGHDGFAVALVK